MKANLTESRSKNSDSNSNNLSWLFENGELVLIGDLTVQTLPLIYQSDIKSHSVNLVKVNAEQLVKLDSAGLAFLVSLSLKRPSSLLEGPVEIFGTQFALDSLLKVYGLRSLLKIADD